MILHTEIRGKGEPAVFLHTGLQTGLTDFVAQREALQKGKKVITPDLRGHGKSYHEDFSNYFEDAANDLKETLDHLEFDNIHLIGCSLGGLVGLVFAKKNPDKLISLTLSGITADKPEDWEEMHAQDIQFQKELLQNIDVVNQLDNMHQSDWKQFIYMAQNQDWYPFEYTSDLANINAPILVMVGEGNKPEVASASKYQGMHENVHVSVIPFCSHLVHEQNPEMYTLILEEFLAETGDD
ncbi:alpha/beta fold hydrolase [Halobacillus amylolyticus]|uniref:Alpha/beta hydrolase n=1 Tax=Halobacillus amylolyticus TaxID=2932259 RepID=A0ABY4HD67_9BACI|nr:alpha/beta hydrolase [Halobacillus amylolyticus]UOR12834.1 alpha/beta hydrolase [Halobacillus amylolyticus]